MKLLFKTAAFVALLFISLHSYSQSKIDVAKQISLAEKQYKELLQNFQDTTKFPQSTSPDGTYKKMPSDWWCSGFFGGTLWYLYEYTKNNDWKQQADKWTMAVQKQQYNTHTHDLGFMLYCPFGNGYRLTNNEAYKNIMLQGAKSLATRFHPQVGVIKSWDSYKGRGSSTVYNYPVIIDNMMNLEFLFWAAKTSGNKEFYNICISHADATLKNHFRPDNSSFHVVCYDSSNGNVLAQKTLQGYSDESAWARGQSWGLYGYTVMYRETKDKKYLQQAIKIANFIINHPRLPKDKVPYWDFDDPAIPNTVRDASAAAVTCSALLELSNYVDKAQKKVFFSTAEEILQSLSSPEYFAAEGNNHFLLKHSTGYKPANSEVDTPIIYADYYYLEALLRYSRMVK